VDEKARGGHGVKKSDIAVIVLRVGALWLVVQALPMVIMLATVIANIHDRPHAGQMMVSVGIPAATFLVQVLTAVVLWFLAPAIARVMVPEPEAPLGPLPEARDGWLVLAVQVLGLYTLVGQIPRLFGVLIFLMKTSTPFEKDIRPPTNQFPIIVVTMLLGLWLTLGAGGIVGAIRRFRQGGREPRGPAAD
jgi:hypothetical protein